MPLSPNEQRDPDLVPTACEADGCDVVKPHGEMYSLKLVYMMPGANLAPFECGAVQHYGCCPEHAEAAAVACLEQHLRPMHRERYQAAQPSRPQLVEVPATERRRRARQPSQG